MEIRSTVIMISWAGGHGLEERALQTGAKIFVEKPIVQKDLLKVIGQAMEN